MYIIIDSHFLCHRAKHSYTNFEDIGDNSGVIFGFLKQVMDFANSFNTNKFIFCWDSKTSKRKEIFPEYKVKEIEYEIELTPEEIEFNERCFVQFDKLREIILPSIGFKNIFSQEGYEADDIVAAIVKEYDTNFKVITRDNDFMQLLEYCDIYDPISKIMHTSETFFEKWGIGPQRWIEVKMIAGCKSDCVPGISGVREKTAIKFLLKNLKPANKKYQDIIEGKDIIERNKKLVSLPFPGTEIPEILDDEFNFDNFYNLMNQYSIDVFLEQRNLNQWRSLFEGFGYNHDNKFDSLGQKTYL